MLVLRALVRDGVVPLLGPPTSIGEVHHGAAYYGLLAPVAWLTGGDSPLAVTAWIAILGIAAVGVVWWFARSMGGPVAGFAAGLAMAASAASVEESTFIWNPNVIALTSAVAVGGAWAAWSSRRTRWWLLAGLGTALTMQGHVLGILLAPVVGALFVADVRRAAGARRKALGGTAAMALIIGLATYLPLIVHELTTGGSEVRALLAYLEQGGGGDAGATALLVRIALVAARVIGWPLAGLITDAPAVVLTSVAVLAVVVAWRWSSPDGGERVAVRWLALAIAWSAVGLAVLAPSLVTVVEGLPNDHYHAFADPLVFALVGLGVAAAARMARPDSARATGLPAAAAAIGMIALVGWNLATAPPAVAPGGTFADADAAAGRIVATAAGRPISLRSLPDFKTTEAIAYPLVRAGHAPVDPGRGAVLVVICDPLFEAVIGGPCGGPAEDRAVAGTPTWSGSSPLERFDASSRAVISIYVRP